MINPVFKEEYYKVREEYLEQLNKLTPEKGLIDVEKFKSKGYWVWNIGIINPKMHIIFGNAKLPETTCIVNLGTWFNCSGRKEGFCDICKECYDKQIEVRFKERTKDRLEHEIFWRSVDAKTFAFELIKKIVKYELDTGTKVTKIRWSEVGEIRNQEDLEKIIECTNIIYENLKIKSYIYTHNKNLNFDIEREYLTINGSGFMVDNEYRVVKDREKEYNELKDISNKRDCICDCTKCSYCSNKDGFIIIEELR